MYRRSLLFVAVAATVAPPLAPVWAEDSAITIDNFTFSPAVLTVPVGAKVVWTNRDDMPHSVVRRMRHLPSSLIRWIGDDVLSR